MSPTAVAAGAAATAGHGIAAPAATETKALDAQVPGAAATAAAAAAPAAAEEEEEEEGPEQQELDAAGVESNCSDVFLDEVGAREDLADFVPQTSVDAGA